MKMYPFSYILDSIQYPQRLIDGESIGWNSNFNQYLSAFRHPYFQSIIESICIFMYQNPELVLITYVFYGFLFLSFLISRRPFRRHWMNLLILYEEFIALCITFVLQALYHWTHHPFFVKLEVKIVRMATKHKYLTLWAMYTSSLWIQWIFIMMLHSTNFYWDCLYGYRYGEPLWFGINLVHSMSATFFIGVYGGVFLGHWTTFPQWTWQQRAQSTSQALDVLLRQHLPHLNTDLQKSLWPLIYDFHHEVLGKQFKRSLCRYSVSQRYLKKLIDSDLGDIVLEYVFAPPVLAVANNKRVNNKLNILWREYGDTNIFISLWLPLKNRLAKESDVELEEGIPTQRGQRVFLVSSDGKSPKTNELVHSMCYFCFKCRQFHSLQDIQHCD